MSTISPKDRFDKALRTIAFEQPVKLHCTLRNQGYLFYALDKVSKDAVVAALQRCGDDQLSSLSDKVTEFLFNKGGHVTLVGNFSKQDKSAFDGLKAVKGVLCHFPSLLRSNRRVTLLLTAVHIYDDGKLLCGSVLKPAEKPEKEDDGEETDKRMPIILREDLPRNCGLSSDWYDGHSHLTLHVAGEYAPKDSNQVMRRVYAPPSSNGQE